LSELSLELQDRNINLYQADEKVRALIQIFEERNYYDCATIAANNLSFEGVQLHKNNNKNDPPTDPNTFYKQLKMSIEERLLSNDDANFVNWTHIVTCLGFSSVYEGRWVDYAMSPLAG
jgi:hypothetical protein